MGFRETVTALVELRKNDPERARKAAQYETGSQCYINPFTPQHRVLEQLWLGLDVDFNSALEATCMDLGDKFNRSPCVAEHADILGRPKNFYFMMADRLQQPSQEQKLAYALSGEAVLAGSPYEACARAVTNFICEVHNATMNDLSPKMLEEFVVHRGATITLQEYLDIRSGKREFSEVCSNRAGQINR